MGIYLDLNCLSFKIGVVTKICRPNCSVFKINKYILKIKYINKLTNFFNIVISSLAICVVLYHMSDTI